MSKESTCVNFYQASKDCKTTSADISEPSARVENKDTHNDTKALLHSAPTSGNSLHRSSALLQIMQV